MTDNPAGVTGNPIQEFLDGGGFPAVADPAGERMRSQVDRLTCLLLHAYLDQDSQTVERLLPDLVGRIGAAGDLGAGQLTCLELLGQMWRELGGVPMTFNPPDGSDDVLVGAAAVASAMTAPTAAVPLSAVQNPEFTDVAIVILAQNIVSRLRSARAVLTRVDAVASEFWSTN